MLRRSITNRPIISLVPLIDVFLILLVFFMVTSTYLDLNMIPATPQDKTPAPRTPVSNNSENASTTALIRLGSDGFPVLRGQKLSVGGLALAIQALPGGVDAQQVIVLPSARATMQALVSVIDTLTISGVTSVRVVQLEPKL